jgi:ParB-like chromosome segregation protein Spo0J
MKRKTGSLKQDPSILELRPVNQIFVSRYRQAMRNGDNFPPLIVEKDGSIIAGNHRFEAYLAEFGENHEVPVVVKSYKDAAERIEDAIRDNARHGCAMDGITRKRAVLALSKLGRSPEAIAQVLGISARRVEEMAGLSVLVIGGRGKLTAQPIKRGLEHMVGKRVTADQYEAHRTADRGVPTIQAAKQLIRWIENEWIDWSDEATRKTMTDLHAAIGEKI